MNKILFSSLLVIASVFDCHCQELKIQWYKTMGGSKNENICFLEQTKDSCYVIVGTTKSKDGDANGNKGYSMIISKLNKNGNILWSKLILIDKSANPTAFFETSDGCYIVASGNEDVKWMSGSIEFKEYMRAHMDSINSISYLDHGGNLLWKKTTLDINDKIFQTKDGNYTSVGSCYSDGLAFNHFDKNGNILWSKSPANTYFFDRKKQPFFQTNDGDLFFIRDSTTSNYSVSSISVSYGTSIIKCNDQGQEIFKISNPGKCYNFLRYNSDNFCLLRKVWEGNQESSSYILADVYSKNGSLLFKNKEIADQKPFLPVYLFGFTPTSDNGFIVSDGDKVKKILVNGMDSWQSPFLQKPIIYTEDNKMNYNAVLDKNDNYYIQTIVSENNSGNLTQGQDNREIVISCYNGQSGVNCWSKSFGKIQETGKIVSFYQNSNCEFILIYSFFNVPNETSACVIKKIDCNGNVLGSTVFNGSSPVVLKDTIDGGLLIGGLIYSKNPNANDYHGGSDISLIKIGF